MRWVFHFRIFMFLNSHAIKSYHRVKLFEFFSWILTQSSLITELKYLNFFDYKNMCMRKMSVLKVQKYNLGTLGNILSLSVKKVSLKGIVDLIFRRSKFYSQTKNFTFDGIHFTDKGHDHQKVFLQWEVALLLASE